MFRQTALLFSMLVHTFISPAFAHVQTNPPAIGARSPSTTACRELSFSGRINGDEEYARELGDKLWVRFAPTKGKWAGLFPLDRQTTLTADLEIGVIMHGT